MGDPFTASDVIFSLKWGCDNTALLSTMGSVYDIEKLFAIFRDNEFFIFRTTLIVASEYVR